MPPIITISAGVAAAMLIQKVPPKYPGGVVPGGAMKSEGTVSLQALISKEGHIESLRVIEGPPLLQQAAIDAIQKWTYRPYLLNGEPVEVETTVSVLFVLGR
jgi:protein TonB